MKSKKLTINGLELESDFKFSGGEIQVRLPRGLEVADKYIIRIDMMDSDSILKTCLVANALVSISGNKEKHIPIHLYTPYFPYARQDRACWEREAASKQVVCKILNNSGIEKVCCLDIHSNNGHDSIEIESIYAKIQDKENYELIIAPDKGAKERARYYANILGGIDVVELEKSRSSEDGRVLPISLTDSQVSLFAGKKCLIVDDICDGGYTFENIAREVSRHTQRLDLFVTHGIFSKGFDALYDSGIYKIITTDSILQNFQEGDRLEMLSQVRDIYL